MDLRVGLGIRMKNNINEAKTKKVNNKRRSDYLQDVDPSHVAVVIDGIDIIRCPSQAQAQAEALATLARLQ
jgi:hypothetical protein